MAFTLAWTHPGLELVAMTWRSVAFATAAAAWKEIPYRP